MKKLNCCCLLLLGLFVGAVSADPVLVTSEWLGERLQDPDLVLVDMGSDATQYQRFHLPGAVYLPYRLLVRRNRAGVSVRVSDERLYRVLGYFGIAWDKQVVVYDDMGGLEASRLFWELERIGHPRVAVLNGGLVKWVLEGRKVVEEPVKPRKVAYRRPAGATMRDNEAVLEDVIPSARAPGTLLLDVRTAEEYRGSPRDRRSGHIPGAKLWPWNQAVAFDQGFVLHKRRELLASLGTVGLRDERTPVLVYCRSGHRSAHTYLTLRSLGFDNVRMYDGSMAEYSKDPKAPVAQGGDRP